LSGFKVKTTSDAASGQSVELLEVGETENSKVPQSIKSSGLILQLCDPFAPKFWNEIPLGDLIVIPLSFLVSFLVVRPLKRT
jgi:hypothetical protein